MSDHRLVKNIRNKSRAYPRSTGCNITLKKIHHTSKRKEAKETTNKKTIIKSHTNSFFWK